MTARKRLALIGLGKMGRAVAQLAPERGWDVVASIGGADNKDARGVTSSFLKGADVAIEFTTPNAGPANARAAVAAGCPIVVGTTGWTDQLPSLSEFVSARNGALLTAPLSASNASCCSAPHTNGFLGGVRRDPPFAFCSVPHSCERGAASLLNPAINRR